MNCEQVQSLLVAYLDGEVTPSERALILAHLSSCTVCQQELNLLSTDRSRVRAALQRRTIHAVPSREAWDRLEARLTEAAQPSSKFAAWFSRKAPSASRASNQFPGGVTMQKRWILSSAVGIVVLLVLAALVAQTVTPVSARQILDRAYEVQAQEADKGIQHTRSEIYTNIEALPEDQATTTIVESYLDVQSGIFRLVITDNETGKVLEAYAYDGSNAYNSASTKGGEQTDDPLTIYRSPQNQPDVVSRKLSNDRRQNGLDAKDMFDKMRNNPNAELVGQETWDDGRTVYVLRSQQPLKVLVENQTTTPTGLVTMYFAVDTYKLLGSRVTIERDGQELLIMSERILIDETLPAESNVTGDLSDLQGITIVDDPSGEHSRPEVIPVEDLASKTQDAYLLETIPDGFSLDVSVLARQPANEQFFYNAIYTKGDDYFMIRTWGEDIKDASWADEHYTTASGLVLHFIVEPGITPAGGQFTSALVEMPEGMTFAINSTLPREMIKALTEELVLVK
jgi:anti-sigma factor RsiW